MTFQYNDGGRAATGRFTKKGGDCVCRSIAIVTGLPYQEVYDKLAEGTFQQRAGKRGNRPRSADHGINTHRKWFKDYMAKLGFTWVPTMQIGVGCKVHLHDGELPDGRLIVVISKHYTAVIDQVIHDIYDPRREQTWIHGDGTQSISRRCVYGYWKLIKQINYESNQN